MLNMFLAEQAQKQAHPQLVVVCSCSWTETSCDFDVVTGITPGSCLGPILFIMHASQLFHVVRKHLPDIQCYADYTQLYLYSFRPDSITSQDEAEASMECCISVIHACMTNNYCKLNDTKNEFLVTGSAQQLKKNQSRQHSCWLNRDPRSLISS